MKLRLGDSDEDGQVLLGGLGQMRSGGWSGATLATIGGATSERRTAAPSGRRAVVDQRRTIGPTNPGRDRRTAV